MSTNKRKSISKKNRFEVFKRDSFTCQYCGASAPDVLLEVDHINPVASGGTNDILNLITSCRDCNSGKGARELDDNSVIAKQKEQLDDLNERRQQLEMMITWRDSLQDADAQKVDALARYFDNYSGHSVNERGKAVLRQLIKKHTLQELYDAIDTSVAQYLELEKSGDEYTAESVEKAFDYIDRIASFRKSTKDKPYLKDLFYIRGILRNRLSYVNETEVINLLEQAYLAGVSIEHLRQIACTEKNWTRFRDEIYKVTGGGK